MSELEGGRESNLEKQRMERRDNVTDQIRQVEPVQIWYGTYYNVTVSVRYLTQQL